PGIFRPLYNLLMSPTDIYLHFADFSAYTAAQKTIGKDFMQPAKWATKALMNTARTGIFSSDRTIKAYADEIWGIKSQVQEQDRW
ncbi:MAG: glycogen/starch/alpha-glucan phosphorylase, partial [Desulfobacteraceae bacterium]|nr:glycogen/starch/alpha-glucan phosphorylase [Desulfobacteraceae bacterium]